MRTEQRVSKLVHVGPRLHLTQYVHVHRASGRDLKSRRGIERGRREHARAVGTVIHGAKSAVCTARTLADMRPPSHPVTQSTSLTTA